MSDGSRSLLIVGMLLTITLMCEGGLEGGCGMSKT